MSNTITRKELARRIAARLGKTIVEVDAILALEHGLIEDELERGNRVKVGAYGVLHVRNASAKLARNPRTGKEVMVPERRKIAFREFGYAKARLNAQAEL